MKETDQTKVVMITGGTSGIGLAAARLFGDQSWTVFVLGRKEPSPGWLPASVTYLSADVTSLESLEAAAKLVYERCGAIDVLLSNAGFGISGPVEYTEPQAAARLMETNFMGSFYAAKAVLPYMRKKGAGRIIFTSSLAAIFPIPFQSFYSASKAAINLLAGALDNEIRSFGVRASVVMPGDVQTAFTEAREKSMAGAEIYGALAEHAVQVMEQDEIHGMKPEAIARVLYKAATSRRSRLVWVPGRKYQALAFLSRFLPHRWIQAALGKVYLGLS